jgi:hypothetical protein
MIFKTKEEQMEWQQKMLNRIEFLQERLSDVKTLVLMYESPFQMLSLIKTEINKIQKEMFLRK